MEPLTSDLDFLTNLGPLVSPKASVQGVPGPLLLTPDLAGSSLLGLPALGHESADRSPVMLCFPLQGINTVFSLKSSACSLKKILKIKFKRKNC